MSKDKSKTEETPTLTKAETKALDKAAKKIETESIVAPPSTETRPHGRPHGGRAIFTKRQVKLLPETGTIADVAAALGIARASVHQWCKRKKNPLPFIEKKDGTKLLGREVLIEWLIATRHFQQKKKQK